MRAYVKKYGKRILLITALYLPTAPMIAMEVAASPAVSTIKKKRKKRVKDMNFAEKLWVCTKGVARLTNPLNYRKNISKMLASAKKVEFFETPSDELARYAYNTGPYELNTTPSIAGFNEQQELLVNDLVQSLSTHMVTSMGPSALSHLLRRTEKKQTLQLQAQIRRLVENDELFFQLEKQLKRFARQQNHIYNYWDDNITVTRNGKTHFFAQVENLLHIVLFHWVYCILPSIIASPISSSCNEMMEQVRSPKMLGLNAAFGLVLHTPFLWLKAGFSNIGESLKRYFSGDDFNLSADFVEGINTLNNTYGFCWGSNEYAKFQKAITHYDECQSAYDTKNSEKNKLKLERAKLHLAKITHDLNAKGTPQDLWHATKYELPKPKAALGSIGKYTQWILSYIPLIHLFSLGSFDQDGTFFLGKYGESDYSGFFGGIAKFKDDYIKSLNINTDRMQNVFFDAVLFAYYRFYKNSKEILHSICESFRNYEAWNLLDLYIKKVELGFNAMHSTHTLLSSDSCLQKSFACELLSRAFIEKPHGYMKQFVKIMKERRSQRQRVKQLGGRSLIEHNLMQNLKPQLQPVLWGMAELDVLYAIAKMIREQDEMHPMCFVQFMPEEGRACLEIKDGVLPMVDNSVPNDVQLGGERPNKMVVSGPNGAGKSIYLKMMGCNVLSAQSLGVAAAKKMKSSWFDTLRTCINPSEKVNQLSKLQAEKVRLDAILSEFDYLAQKNPSHKELFITDEPLSGTTNKIAGRFIYEYGQKIAQLPGLAVCMATHNEKPTELAQQGNYSNYQVGMRMNEKGLPEATFKVTEGIPAWWFSTEQEDMQKQDAFVRFTVAQKHQEDLLARQKELQKVIQLCTEKLEKREYSSKEEKMAYKLQLKIAERELDQIEHELVQTAEKLRKWSG